MIKTEVKPYLLTIILTVLNIAFITSIIFTQFKINEIEKVTFEHKQVNDTNLNYLNGLSNVLAGLSKVETPNLDEFIDDYVFDSSLEAIVFREMVKKISLSGDDYIVKDELNVIQSSSYGNMGQITLGYSFQDINYGKMIELFSLIIQNDRYDYLNDISLTRNSKDLTMNISFSYTNLGFVVE